MEKDSQRGLEKLMVWRKAIELVAMIYEQIFPCLPPEEKWAMESQLRRAAQSIPANIAEGYGRFYYQDHIRFCYIARGSLEETYSHLSLALRLGYLDEDQFNRLTAEIIELRRMLSGYISFLKSSKPGASEPGADHLIHDDLAFYNDSLSETSPGPELPD